MTDEQKRQIRNLRKSGYGYSSIAELLSLTKSQVSSFCRRNKITADVASEYHSKLRFCRQCGKPLTQVKGRRETKFCSDKCRNAWWNSHPELVNRRAVYEFICPQCSGGFTAYGNNHRKYCSHKCYIQARFGGSDE